MKTLTALLASLMLCACGGLDESLAPEAATNDTPPALENSPPPPPEMTMPEPVPPRVYKGDLTWTKEQIQLQMRERPVEERFFYPINLNAPPPGLPPPACPMCS